jgi:hypothetical protein
MTYRVQWQPVLQIVIVELDNEHGCICQFIDNQIICFVIVIIGLLYNLQTLLKDTGDIWVCVLQEVDGLLLVGLGLGLGIVFQSEGLGHLGVMFFTLNF